MSPPVDEELSRLIALEGAVNFRDVGGYPTTDGRRVRWRRMFRADGLTKLTEGDLVVLADLGIATVVDLRTSTELENGRFPTDQHPVTFHHYPLLDELPDFEAFKVAPGMLANQYLTIAREAGPQIAGVLRVIAADDAQPVVVHCTAGKDRTGVLTAVLLGCLGVSEDDIVADYLLSGAAMGKLREKLVEVYPEAADAIRDANEVFGATEDSIRELLAMFRADYGSIEAYARAAGVDDSVIDALRASLTEGA